MIHSAPTVHPIDMTAAAAADTSLTETQVASLARTYDDVSRPIWVHDLSDRCVYRNRPAMSASRWSDEVLVFEIVDDRGRTVGHLKAGRP